MNMLDTEKEYYSTELNKAQNMVAKCFKLSSKASEISRMSYSYHVVPILDQFEAFTVINVFG